MTGQAGGTARTSDRLAGIVAFARELAAKPGFELASVIDLVVERAQALTGAEGASLSLLDEGDLIVRAVAGISTSALNEVISQSSASWSALASGRSILIADTASDDRIYAGLRGRFGEHSLVCAPIFHGERAIGVLHLISSSAREPLGDDDLHTLELLAVVLSSALGQAAELRADVTARVEAEHARRLVQQRFDAMAESIDEAFWMADLDSGEVLYANPAFARIWGVTQDEALANAALRVGLVHMDDRDRFLARWEQIDRGFDLEYRIVQPGGEVRWVRDRVFHAERDGSRLVLGISRDITDSVHERERAREEAERRDAERRMSQKLEAVGQLAAGIAHEINTPIQFVGDSVQFLDGAFGDVTRLVGEYREIVDAVRRGETVAAAAVERVEQAEEDADLSYLLERVPQAFRRTFDGISRVSTIVKAMKSFAHPDSNEQAPADLNEALETTLVVATNEYKYVADVELDLGDIPTVVCHLGDLNQVFLNLVVNAAHAIEEHAKGSGERGVIRVATERAGDQVLVSISDTGGGIPDGIRNRIFDPFFTTKEVGRGTGQGLAMARAVIVDKHHGSLEVDSEPGRGSTFRISLPISGKDAMEARAA